MIKWLYVKMLDIVNENNINMFKIVWNEKK